MKKSRCKHKWEYFEGKEKGKDIFRCEKCGLSKWVVGLPPIEEVQKEDKNLHHVLDDGLFPTPKEPEEWKEIEEVVNKFLRQSAVEEGSEEERKLMKDIFNDKTYSIWRKSLINLIQSLLSQKDKDWEQQIDGIVGLRQFDLHGEQVIKVKDLYLIVLLKQNK